MESQQKAFLKIKDITRKRMDTAITSEELQYDCLSILSADCQVEKCDIDQFVEEQRVTVLVYYAEKTISMEEVIVSNGL